MEKKIAVLRGDGIGPEVVNESIKVLERVAQKFGHTFHYYDIIGGIAGLEAYGDALRPQDYELGRSCDSILFGSVYPQLIQASPLKDTVARELDLIVLRENTAGIFYAGKYRKEIGGELTACDECVYTWSQIERHARCAFDLAMGRKKHVTMVNKPNAMETGVLWQTVYEKVAEEYPEVHYETMLIDGCAARLVSRPGYFDVIAAENMFGDILSDLANSAAGSMGIAGSGDIGSEGKGLYECAGGSAPDIASQNIANPIAEILSAALMLRLSFHMTVEADAIEAAIVKVLDDGYRTGDIMTPGGKRLSCSDMGAAISEAI